MHSRQTESVYLPLKIDEIHHLITYSHDEKEKLHFQRFESIAIENGNLSLREEKKKRRVCACHMSETRLIQ